MLYPDWKEDGIRKLANVAAGATSDARWRVIDDVDTNADTSRFTINSLMVHRATEEDESYMGPHRRAVGSSGTLDTKSKGKG